MSTGEKVEELLGEFRTRIEELKDEALASVEEVRADAAEKVARYEDAREELEGVEARLAMLEAEKEGLPVEHSRAVLADDAREELRLKERFSTISEEIATLEDCRASLEEEMAKLLPGLPGPPRTGTTHLAASTDGWQRSPRRSGAPWSILGSRW